MNSRTFRVTLVGAVIAALMSLPVLVALPMLLLFAGPGAGSHPCINLAGVVASAGGPVRLPVTGGFTVTSEYGMRVNPGRLYFGLYRMHAGIDFAMHTPGSQVVAAAGGVVHSTPTTAGGGNIVVIDHGGGLMTRYLHLRTRLVTVGESVWPGRAIGIEGESGNSRGAHLHFEVLQSGMAQDPRTWLTAAGVVMPGPRSSGTAPPATATPGAGEEPHIIAAPAALTTTAVIHTTQPVTGAIPAAVGRWQGEQVRNASLIIRAGQAMGVDARTITIGVMTAMGESSLRNVDHGDRAGPDSRGLFQQRANGAWGSYADRMNPTTAATNFFRALLAVPGYATLEPTIAAHKAQRNADPYHYRPFWAEAVTMVSTLTGDPALLAALPAGGYLDGCDELTDLPGAGDGSGEAIVRAAEHYLGMPYSWGGGGIDGPSTGIYTSPSLNGTTTVGFDCSGLTQFAVHRGTGQTIPRTSNAQQQDPTARVVTRDQIRPGDLIAFSDTGAPGTYDHIGIYAGNNEMIHVPRPGRSVERVNLDGYYSAKTWTILRYATG